MKSVVKLPASVLLNDIYSTINSMYVLLVPATIHCLLNNSTQNAGKFPNSLGLFFNGRTIGPAEERSPDTASPGGGGGGSIGKGMLGRST